MAVMRTHRETGRLFVYNRSRAICAARPSYGSCGRQRETEDCFWGAGLRPVPRDPRRKRRSRETAPRGALQQPSHPSCFHGDAAKTPPDLH